mgnify:CR=1 FL=1
MFLSNIISYNQTSEDLLFRVKLWVQIWRTPSEYYKTILSTEIELVFKHASYKRYKISFIWPHITLLSFSPFQVGEVLPWTVAFTRTDNLKVRSTFYLSGRHRPYGSSRTDTVLSPTPSYAFHRWFCLTLTRPDNLKVRSTFYLSGRHRPYGSSRPDTVLSPTPSYTFHRRIC